MRAQAFSSVWGGGFIGSLEARQDVDARPGRGRSWIRTRYPLVAGETDPPVAAFLKPVDTANGLVVREPARPDSEKTLSVLSDIRGPVGTAAQSLTLRLGENWPGGPK
jgi:hypothetical protein